MIKLIMLIFVVFIIAFVFCVGGVIGMATWPYAINTWVGYANETQEVQANPIKLRHGFLMGMVPGAGQIGIPFALITCVCDVIFIPDYE
jgi:hypothetical protein